MSFEGKAIKSYATEIARIIEHDGKQAVIFNETGYSVTKSQAQSCIRRAIPGYMPTFIIGGIGMGCSLDFHGQEGSRLFEYAINKAEESKAAAIKARQRKPYHLERQRGWLSEAKRVNEFFGLEVDEGTINRLGEIAQQERDRVAAIIEAKNAARRAECAPLLELWKNGDVSIHVHRFSHLFPVVFRIERDELVSSYGARVSLKAAYMEVKFVEKNREKGWKTNGDTMVVDGYQFVQISEKEVQIGCHHITWEEFDRIAPIIKAWGEEYNLSKGYC